MNERTRSRNASWSSVKMSLRMASGGVRLGEIGGPLRVALVVRADQPPVHAARNHRDGAQLPAEFLEQAVGLAVIARHAGRHAVLPHVLAAAAARHHVID